MIRSNPKGVLILLFIIIGIHSKALPDVPAKYTYDKMYFCTATNSKYYSALLNLIGSIHKYNYEQLGEIAVFNLGLSQKQITELKSIEKVGVYEVDKVHPDIIKPFATRKNGRKKVPGWYAFQPVVVKQALDMFPYVLYIDSGAVILSPVDDYFRHIVEHDYFLVTCGHDIRWMTTEFVANKFDLYSKERSWILDETTLGVAGGLIGVTKNMYDPFILPLYELARDLRNFKDDGTTPKGFGTGRHSQTLYSIYARLLNLTVMEDRDHGNLLVNGKKVPAGIVEWKRDITKDSKIFHCRTMKPFNNKPSIRYKK